jgi:hypothetical protein
VRADADPGGGEDAALARPHRFDAVRIAPRIERGARAVEGAEVDRIGEWTARDVDREAREGGGE